MSDQKPQLKLIQNRTIDHHVITQVVMKIKSHWGDVIYIFSTNRLNMVY